MSAHAGLPDLDVVATAPDSDLDPVSEESLA